MVHDVTPPARPRQGCQAAVSRCFFPIRKRRDALFAEKREDPLGPAAGDAKHFKHARGNVRSQFLQNGMSSAVVEVSDNPGDGFANALVHETFGIDCRLVRAASSWHAEVSGTLRNGGGTVARSVG